MFLQGARVQLFFSFAAPRGWLPRLWPSSSVGGQLTPPGPAEIHLAAQKRGMDSQVLLFSLTVPGKKAPGPVFQMSTITLRTPGPLLGLLGAAATHALRCDLRAL